VLAVERCDAAAVDEQVTLFRGGAFVPS